MLRARRKILEKIAFLNLEKTAIQSQVRTVIYNDKGTNDETEINNHIYSFFQLFV